MVLFESMVRELGVTWVRLNVFPDNLAAISLSETQGYRKTNFNMQKEL